MTCQPAPDGAPCSSGNGNPCIIHIAGPCQADPECTSELEIPEFDSPPIATGGTIEIFIKGDIDTLQIQTMVTAIDDHDLNSINVFPDPGSSNVLNEVIPVLAIEGLLYRLSVRRLSQGGEQSSEWVHYDFTTTDTVYTMLIDNGDVMVDNDGFTIITDD